MDDYQFHVIITHPLDADISYQSYFGQVTSYDWAADMRIPSSIKFNLILF